MTGERSCCVGVYTDIKVIAMVGFSAPLDPSSPPPSVLVQLPPISESTGTSPTQQLRSPVIRSDHGDDFNIGVDFIEFIDVEVVELDERLRPCSCT
jgi:hypothetical protein